jgi:hypothetical protein
MARGRHRLLVLMGLVVTAAVALAVLAKGAPPCPPVIAGLMPKIGAEVAGDYQSMGITGKGFGVAKIPYKPPCPCPSSDPYPAKVSAELLHYEGEGVQLLQMQIEGVEQQWIQDTLAEFRRRQPAPTAHNALHATRTEKVPGGTLVLYDYKSQCLTDCKGEGYPEGDYVVPHVNLLGVSHTDSSSVVVTVEGAIPVDMAKSLAQEIFQNLKNAKFSAPGTGN